MIATCNCCDAIVEGEEVLDVRGYCKTCQEETDSAPPQPWESV